MEQFQSNTYLKPAQDLVVDNFAVDASQIDNAVLKRLISEIDFDKENKISAYNRTHNRHNRGR